MDEVFKLLDSCDELGSVELRLAVWRQVRGGLLDCEVVEFEVLSELLNLEIELLDLDCHRLVILDESALLFIHHS